MPSDYATTKLKASLVLAFHDEDFSSVPALMADYTASSPGLDLVGLSELCRSLIGEIVDKQDRMAFYSQYCEIIDSLASTPEIAAYMKAREKVRFYTNQSPTELLAAIDEFRQVCYPEEKEWLDNAEIGVCLSTRDYERIRKILAK